MDPGNTAIELAQQFGEDGAAQALEKWAAEHGTLAEKAAIDAERQLRQEIEAEQVRKRKRGGGSLSTFLPPFYICQNGKTFGKTFGKCKKA